jgi:myo-inositol-1(or 4)-monophosphatase
MLMVREAGGKVVDYRGRSTPPVDTRGLMARPLVAGNLKIVDALQNKIVATGYANALD